MRPVGTTLYNYDGIKEINNNGIIHWERLCPKCNKILHHKCKISARACYRQKRVCGSCGSWTKGQTKETNETIRNYSKKHSEWLKDFRKTNPPWNKGLTKENNAIVKYISECRLGIKHSEETRKIIGKYTKKLWDSGYWGGRATDEWIRYRHKVQWLTRTTIKKLPNYDPSKRGKSGIVGAYQIDHIIPVKYGFMNKIDAKIIADVTNLQFIPWEENNKKGAKYDGQNKVQSTTSKLV
jgi:transcription elongation factor Elf1